MSAYEHSPLVHQPHQRRSREALARIVSSAELLLKTKGYDGFSMAALAELAGMPIGNIYRRFRGKADLLQILKENATDRIEQTELEYLSRGDLPDIDSVVHRVMDGVVMAFTSDESLHTILFNEGGQDPAIDRIGWDSRYRIYGHYRDSLLPLLSHVPQERAEMLAQVSFSIISAAIVGKARTTNAMLNSLSWSALSEEFSAAAIAYISCRISAI